MVGRAIRPTSSMLMPRSPAWAKLSPESLSTTRRYGVSRIVPSAMIGLSLASEARQCGERHLIIAHKSLRAALAARQPVRSTLVFLSARALLTDFPALESNDLHLGFIRQLPDGLRLFLDEW